MEIKHDHYNESKISIQNYVLKINASNNMGNIKDVISAVAFVIVLIVSAVDGIIGVSVSSDPQPVMMRILD